MNDAPTQRKRRADILRVNLRPGTHHFAHATRRWPRWTIDDIAEALTGFSEGYDVGIVGCQKHRFSKQEVINIFHWILYKKRPPWERRFLIRGTLRQKKFFEYYLGSLGNSTRAARLAGYRHPKQRGYELHNALTQAG